MLEIDNSVEIPQGATHRIDGIYYKVGRHNLVYYYHPAEQEWQNSDIYKTLPCSQPSYSKPLNHVRRG